MRSAGNKAVVGLDIEPGYIVAVQTGSGRQPTVTHAASVQLRPGVVTEGEVTDVDALAEALRSLFADRKLGRRVRIGVANQRIVMRTLHLPPMEAKDIDSAVRFQAQEHIPMPLEHAVLEHHSLGVVQTADGPRTRVVLVAARRDMIERVLAAVRQAGLRAEGIDLSAFAMIRALHRPGRDGATMYVSLGGMTNIAIAVGTTCVFTRAASHGAEQIATDLAERRGLTLDHARGWIEHVGLSVAVEDVDGETEIIAEAREVALEGMRRIADEIRNSLDFHRMHDAGGEVRQIVLTGPLSGIEGVADYLYSETGLPVELGAVAELSPGALAGTAPERATVAAGLAVAEVAA